MKRLLSREKEEERTVELNDVELARMDVVFLKYEFGEVLWGKKEVVLFVVK